MKEKITTKTPHPKSFVDFILSLGSPFEVIKSAVPNPNFNTRKFRALSDLKLENEVGDIVVVTESRRFPRGRINHTNIYNGNKYEQPNAPGRMLASYPTDDVREAVKMHYRVLEYFGGMSRVK